MAAALTKPRGSRARARLSAAFARDVAPDLAALERVRRRCRLGYAAAVAVMLAGIFLAFLWLPDPGHALFASGVAVAVGLVGMFGAQRGYSVRMRHAVMPAICRAIGDVGHSVGDAAEIDFDSLAAIGLVPGHHRRRIDDVFRGRHRDTGFVMAEVRLRRTGGGRKRSSSTVFRGLVMAIEVPRRIPARILIARDVGAIGNRLLGWVRSLGALQHVPLDDQAFESRFEVYADRADVARSTLTADLCANLGAFASLLDAPFQAAFVADSFFVALPRRGDLFRIGSLFRSTAALENDAAAVMEEVQIVHRLIDCLHGDPPRPTRHVYDPAAPQTADPGPVVRA